MVPPDPLPDPQERPGRYLSISPAAFEALIRRLRAERPQGPAWVVPPSLARLHPETVRVLSKTGSVVHLAHAAALFGESSDALAARIDALQLLAFAAPDGSFVPPHAQASGPESARRTILHEIVPALLALFGGTEMAFLLLATPHSLYPDERPEYRTIFDWATRSVHHTAIRAWCAEVVTPADDRGPFA
jgi:hypothetical protein